MWNVPIQKFDFERIIPIYGFKTRKTPTDLFIGLNFAYLEVDEITPRFPHQKNCCVLRLDPCEFTVSVLKEIIYANNIVGVVSKNTIDVTLYTEEVNGTDFFKIYFS